MKSANTPHPKSISGAGGGWVIPKSNFIPISHSGVGTKVSLRSSRCVLRSASAQFLSPGSQVTDSLRAKSSRDHKRGCFPVGSASLALRHSRKLGPRPAGDAFTGRDPGGPGRGSRTQARTGRVGPTPPAAQRGFDSDRVSPPGLLRRGGSRRATPAAAGCAGPAGAHTCARAALDPAGTPASPAHCVRARRAAAVPDGGRGPGRRQHLPGSTSSSTGGSSRAGSPWHHLPPPPRPRRRLPTAHRAPPTDTTAGVPGAGRGPELRAGGRGRGGEGTLSGPSALGQGPGGRGPRPVRAEGPGRYGDPPKAAPRALQGRGHRRGWVCYCRLRPFLRGARRETVGGGWGAPGGRGGAERRAQVRKSAGRREKGGGSALSRGRPACDFAVLFWPGDTAGAPFGGASRGPAADCPKVILTFLATASWPEADPAEFWISPRSNSLSLSTCRGGAGPTEVVCPRRPSAYRARSVRGWRTWLWPGQARLPPPHPHRRHLKQLISGSGNFECGAARFFSDQVSQRKCPRDQKELSLGRLEWRCKQHDPQFSAL